MPNLSQAEARNNANFVLIFVKLTGVCVTDDVKLATPTSFDEKNKNKQRNVIVHKQTIFLETVQEKNMDHKTLAQ